MAPWQVTGQEEEAKKRERNDQDKKRGHQEHRTEENHLRNVGHQEHRTEENQDRATNRTE